MEADLIKKSGRCRISTALRRRGAWCRRRPSRRREPGFNENSVRIEFYLLSPLKIDVVGQFVLIGQGVVGEMGRQMLPGFLDAFDQSFLKTASPEFRGHHCRQMLPEIQADLGMDPFVPENDEPAPRRDEEKEDSVPLFRVRHAEALKRLFRDGSHSPPEKRGYGNADFPRRPLLAGLNGLSNPRGIDRPDEFSPMHEGHRSLLGSTSRRKLLRRRISRPRREISRRRRSPLLPGRP